MEIYVADQTMDFLRSLPVGVALALLYDAFRIVRIALPHRRVVVTVEDVLFWAISGLVTFFFLLGSVDGKVRFFLLVGMIIGAAVYHVTLSPVIMKCSRAIIRVVHAFLRFIFRFLVRPVYRLVYWMISWMVRPFQFIGGLAKKLLQKLKYGLKKRRIVLYNHIKGWKKTKGRQEKPEEPATWM